MKPRAIILNGTSSSGKTSIAKAIQRLVGVPCLHASLDAFVDMFDWTAISNDAERRACHAFGVSAFHRCLPIIIESGYLIVIDHVFERLSWYRDCLTAVQAATVLLVGVHCPVEIVEERESKRPDRRKGLARWQFDIVHNAKTYDVEVDTSLLSAEACAGLIIHRLGLSGDQR